MKIPERFDSPITSCLSSSRSATVEKTTVDSTKMGRIGEESASEKEEVEGRKGQDKAKTLAKEEREAKVEEDEEGEEEEEVDISTATIQQQDLFFEGLEMRGQAGTCLIVRLPVYCTCSRCKYTFEWVFRLPSSPPPLLSASISTSRGKGADGAAAQTQPLTSVPPHTSSCQRCRQPLGLIFTGALIHAFAYCGGTFQLANCLLFEVQVGSAEVVITCANCCNAEARIIVSRCRFQFHR